MDISATRADAAQPLAIKRYQPFVPATDFDNSLAFYAALGVHAKPLGYGLAAMSLGPVSFILQRRPDDGRQVAEQLCMQLGVEDLEAWWAHLNTLDLRRRFGASTLRVNALADWGLAPVYLWDPAGVTWVIREA